MNKKTEVVLLLILIIFSFGIRLITLDKGAFFGADAFYHYSIVEQGLKQGKLTGNNNLDLCYTGVKSGHPIGFYMTPYFLSYILGLDNAFNLTPVIVGTLTILLLYFFTAMLFNKEIGFIAAFVLAGLNAHLARSVALVYRGDNFVLPFLLGGLILALLYLKENQIKKKAIYAVLAGIVTGISVLFWNGAILAIGVFNIAVTLYIVFDYLYKKEVKLNMLFSSLALLVQVVLIQIIAYNFLTVFKRFYTHGYLIYFVAPVLVLFILLELGHRLPKKNSIMRYAPFAIVALGGLFAVLIKREKINELFSGFGMVTPTNIFTATIQELKPLTGDYFWFHMWIIAIFAAIGILVIITKWSNKRMAFWALAIPITYMMLSSKRFVFFASVPAAILAGISISAIMKGLEKSINKKILLIIPAVIIIASAYYGANSINTLLIPRAQPDLIESMKWFGASSAEDACMVTTWEKGGMVQYYAKRHSYTSSVGGQSIPRINNSNAFYLTNQAPNFGKGNLYVFVQEEDLLQILSMNQLTKIQGIGGSIVSRETQKDTEDYGEIILKSDSSNERFMVRQSKKEPEKIGSFRIVKDKLIPIKTLVMNQNNFSVSFVTNQSADPGCIYIGRKLMAYFSPNLCDSNMVSMLAGNTIPNMKQIYMNSGISIYRIE